MKQFFSQASDEKELLQLEEKKFGQVLFLVLVLVTSILDFILTIFNNLSIQSNYKNNIVVETINYSQPVSPMLQLGASITAKISSTTNAIVYAFGHPDFKKYVNEKIKEKQVRTSVENTVRTTQF